MPLKIDDGPPATAGRVWAVPVVTPFRAGLAAAVVVLTVAPLIASGTINPGEGASHQAVVTTAWVAAAFWFSGSSALIGGRRRVVAGPVRELWAAGAWLFLVHAATAFHAAHGWSHARAFAHVEAASGYGAGLFVNYLFGMVWVADAAWLCAAPTVYQGRPRRVGRAVHGFLAFVAFNATVVYATGPLRWAALGAFAVLAARYWNGTRRAPG